MAQLTDLIDFLSTPASYPELTTAVEIVQTHVSVVAICDHYVYKIKKPVNFEFLDFSTLEKRKFFCQEEIRLNERLSTDIYIDLAEIRMQDDQLSFTPNGDLIEYAVKMRRLEAGGFFDGLVAEDRDEERHYKIILGRLTDFYRSLPPQQYDDSYGTPESIAYIISENRALREVFIDQTLITTQEQGIARFQEDFLRRQEELLKDRVSNGWIRDVHGDLRLEHLHFNGEVLNIYDCIEFKERLRVNDVVNDIAFLNMELEFNGRYQQSRWIYEQLCEALGDSRQLELWRFYKLHRACVRGMVHAVAGNETEIDAPEREEHLVKSKKLFGLATRYAMLSSQPTVVVVYGGTATGKSTVAHRLSTLLHAPLVQSDAVRKSLEDLPAYERPPTPVRDRLYSTGMTTRTYDALMASAQQLLDQYNVAIIDARFPTVASRDRLRSYFENCRLIWIRTEASMDVRKQRLAKREQASSLSDARLDNWEALLEGESELTENDTPHLLLSTDRSIAYNIDQVLEALAAAKTQAGN